MKHETESSERGNPGLSVSKRSMLRAAWVAPVIVAINLPRSRYAANMSGSARRSKPDHHKGGHKDQNHKYRIAKSMHVQQRRIDEICSGTRAISADTAVRLERLFGMSAQAWLNLQSQYDLEVAAGDLRQRIGAEVLRSLQRRPRFPADGIELSRYIVLHEGIVAKFPYIVIDAETGVPALWQQTSTSGRCRRAFARWSSPRPLAIS